MRRLHLLGRPRSRHRLQRAGLGPGQATFPEQATVLCSHARWALWLTGTEPFRYRAMCFLPIIPLSLLSRVELGLLTVSQGLLLAAVLLTQLFKVEQGLSVLGEAVLLVSVEQGLMPWLRAVRCKANGRRVSMASHTTLPHRLLFLTLKQ